MSFLDISNFEILKFYSEDLLRSIKHFQDFENIMLGFLNV